MDDDPHLILLVLLGLLILSAFFSAAEVAFIALSPAKVRILQERKTRAARLAAYLKSRPQKFLATILIGNNLVNIFSAGLATVFATEFFGSSGLGIATGGMTLAILIFGEIVPKTFAQRYAENFVLFAAFPLIVLEKIFTPLTFLAEKFLPASVEKISEEEVVAAVDLGTESGDIETHEKEMIKNIFEFTDTRVEDVMIPRVEIVALSQTTSVDEAHKVFASQVFSRIPVFTESIDQIIGILSLRDIFEFRGSENVEISTLNLRKPIFTPKNRPISALFAELKLRHTHIAIVVDEYGGTLGLVTLEDLLEEIVGEIEDEVDEENTKIQKLNSKIALVPGNAPLIKIDEILQTELAQGEFESKNLAFLLLEKFERMPQKNAKLRWQNVNFTVEKVSPNRIEQVKIEKV
jgi:putative hemolysin